MKPNIMIALTCTSCGLQFAVPTTALDTTNPIACPGCGDLDSYQDLDSDGYEMVYMIEASRAEALRIEEEEDKKIDRLMQQERDMMDEAYIHDLRFGSYAEEEGYPDD